MRKRVVHTLPAVDNKREQAGCIPEGLHTRAAAPCKQEGPRLSWERAMGDQIRILRELRPAKRRLPRVRLRLRQRVFSYNYWTVRAREYFIQGKLFRRIFFEYLIVENVPTTAEPEAAFSASFLRQSGG